MDNNKKTGGMIVGGIILLLVVIGMFSGGSKSSSDSPSGRPAGMSESDYNSVNGRFRKEGMNAKEADEVTRAVNNFHQAQQRKGR